MKTYLRVLAGGFLLLGIAAFAQGQPPGTAPADPATAKDSADAAAKSMSQQPLSAFEQLGANFATNARIGELQWTEEQFNAFAAGVSDGFHHRAQPFQSNAQSLFAAMGARIQALDRQRQQELFQDPKYLQKFIRDTRKALNLQQTDSGLCYVVQGSSDALRPTTNDTVVVSFDVTASDLKTELTPLSVSRLRVKVSDLLPGLAEAVQMMGQESRGVFMLPPALSYGEGKWPASVDKNTPLIYRLTLHEIQPAAAPSP